MTQLRPRIEINYINDPNKKKRSGNRSTSNSDNTNPRINHSIISFDFDAFDSFDQVLLKTLKDLIRSKLNLDYSRQRLMSVDKKQILDSDHKKLIEFGLKDGDQIILKDLGPQISWRTVFLIEYLGPLLIHPLFYTSNPISNSIYGGPIDHSRLQNFAFGMVNIHFLKRELETVFVHRFSNATMPLRNIFKNSFHYWVLSGFLLAGPIYGTKSSAQNVQGTYLDSTGWLIFWSALWTYAEISNLLVHLHLRSLRPAGSKTRKLPLGGYGFKFVSSPNYLFESLAWLSYTAMIGFQWPGCLFTLISFGQMCLWSIKKLKAYRKEFGNQVPSNWKSIIPFVI